VKRLSGFHLENKEAANVITPDYSTAAIQSRESKIRLSRFTLFPQLTEDCTCDQQDKQQSTPCGRHCARPGRVSTLSFALTLLLAFLTAPLLG